MLSNLKIISVYCNHNIEIGVSMVYRDFKKPIFMLQIDEICTNNKIQISNLFRDH